MLPVDMEEDLLPHLLNSNLKKAALLHLPV